MSFLWKILFHCFYFYHTVWVHICITVVKWWNGEIMIWWSGDMVASLEYLNMVLGWIGANFIFRFPNDVMVNQYFLYIWWNGEIIIWCSGDTIWWNCLVMNRFLGTHFHQWWNGEKVKCNFLVGVNCFVGVKIFLWDDVLGDNCRWSGFFPQVCYPGGIFPGQSPGTIRPLGILVTHYQDAIFPREMSWYTLVIL